MVYVPVAKRRHAKKIALTVIKEKLAACANILGPSVSLYQWKGKVVSGREFILMLKTTEAKFSKLERRIAELHPYDCPCIAKIGLAGLNAPYLKWLVKSVS